MSNVVEIARSYIGKVEYVFGASDPDSGYSDCSGFTQTVFRKAGYTIGRDTESVWTDTSLQNVDMSNLQAGDLILFKDTYNSGMVDGVSHIGIYVGDSRFIHCGSSGVNEQDLNSQYWLSHYLGAKRVVGASSGVNDFKNSSEWGLEWWGDIVVVIISVLLILTGIVMLILGVKGTLYDNVIKEII